MGAMVKTKKEKTKQAIIDTAVRLISLYGYNATTTSVIAKETGLSEAIIFKYFKNKENLLREIGNVAIGQIFEHISLIPLRKNVDFSKNFSFREFIKSILLERLIFFEKNREIITILLAEMQYSEKLLSLTKETLYPKVYEAFNVVRKIIAAKGAIPENLANAVLRIMTGMLTSLITQKYLLHIDLTQDEIEDEIETILNIIEEAVANHRDKFNGCGK
jgi:AcrR family transcriptional regulator